MLPFAAVDTASWLVHPFSGAVGAIILSAAVRALPEPGSTGTNPFSALYGWFFRFMNGILANFDRAFPVSPPLAVPTRDIHDTAGYRRSTHSAHADSIHSEAEITRNGLGSEPAASSFSFKD